MLVCACLLGTSIASYATEPEEEELPVSVEPAPELPVGDLPSEDTGPEDGGGEVVIEDGSNVYHIDADTIIIQTVPADEASPGDDPEAPEDLEDADPEDEDPPSETDLEQGALLEDPPDIAAHALGADGFPFYGSCWVRGQAPSLGSVLLLFPMNYKDGYVGLDSSGRIFNVSNSSWTGVMYVGSTSYTVTFGAWGLPSYRVYNGSGYQNVTLYLTPEDTDILLPHGPSPVYRVPDLLPYASFLLLGGVFICCMRKS